MGQEEAFKAAMTQINEDVEGKLDRMELEPLKSYFGKWEIGIHFHWYYYADKKLNRMKATPILSQADAVLTDEAAGFRKPLRFRCISCDKPVGIRPNE